MSLSMESFGKLTLSGINERAVPSSSGMSVESVAAGHRFAASLQDDGLDELANNVMEMIEGID